MKFIWTKFIRKWKFVEYIVRISKSIVLPGFEGVNIYNVAKFVWEGCHKGRLLTRASAISFKILLALAPTLVLLFTLIPYVPVDNFQQELISSVERLLPQSTFQLVEDTLTDLIARKHDTFLSISFILGLFYASNSIMALFEGFNGSYHIQHSPNPLKIRLASIFLVFFLPLFIVPAFLIITLSETVLDFIKEAGLLKSGIEVILILFSKWLTVLLFFNLAISTLYNIGTRRKEIKWKFFSPGSILSTLAFVVVSQGFAFYVNNFGNYNKFYGSLGTIVVLLMWVNFNSIILLVGYELNASIQKADEQKKLN